MVVAELQGFPGQARRSENLKPTGAGPTCRYGLSCGRFILRTGAS